MMKEKHQLRVRDVPGAVKEKKHRELAEHSSANSARDRWKDFDDRCLGTCCEQPEEQSQAEVTKAMPTGWHLAHIFTLQEMGMAAWPTGGASTLELFLAETHLEDYDDMWKEMMETKMTWKWKRMG